MSTFSYDRNGNAWIIGIMESNPTSPLAGRSRIDTRAGAEKLPIGTFEQLQKLFVQLQKVNYLKLKTPRVSIM